MDYIAEGFTKALAMIFSLDREFWGIVGLSLYVSSIATVIAMLFGIPIATCMGIGKFRGQRVVARILYTCMSSPSILVGLLVCLFLSRRGPFGFLNLIYTPEGMIIAQTILIFPLITGLTYDIVRNRGQRAVMTAKTLGASKLQIVPFVIRDLRKDLFINVVTGFSRAISEVGTVMMVGGNIKGKTRVMTTAISRLNSMGEYETAIALGITLLLLSLIINSIIYSYKENKT